MQAAASPAGHLWLLTGTARPGASTTTVHGSKLLWDTLRHGVEFTLRHSPLRYWAGRFAWVLRRLLNQLGFLPCPSKAY